MLGPSRFRFRSASFLLAAVLAPALPLGAASEPDWAFHVRIDRGWEAAAVRHALRGAIRRLEAAECQKIFSDFTDASGVPLREKLEASGQTGQAYLGELLFYAGGDRSRCREASVAASTFPGSRVVFVCTAEFMRGLSRNPRYMEAILIHEALHTLGLGENPPTSGAITARVLKRCAR